MKKKPVRILPSFITPSSPGLKKFNDGGGVSEPIVTDPPKDPPKDRSHLTKTDIKEFQKILKKEGLYTGAIDGQWGDGTEEAFINSRTFASVEPSVKEGFIRSFLPSNVAQLVNKQTGSAKWETTLYLMIRREYS